MAGVARPTACLPGGLLLVRMIPGTFFFAYVAFQVFYFFLFYCVLCPCPVSSCEQTPAVTSLPFDLGLGHPRDLEQMTLKGDLVPVFYTGTQGLFGEGLRLGWD